MKYKVVQTLDMPGAPIPDYGEMVRNEGIEVDFQKKQCSTEDEMIAFAHDADAVIGAAVVQPFTRRVIEGLGRCRFILSMGIGYDYLDVGAATEHGIIVANVPDTSLEEVSDHAMALILALTRGIIRLNDTVKGGGWKAEPDLDIQQTIWPGMSSLRGQTMGLIGFGRIPRTLVPKAKGFGLTVLAHDPYANQRFFDDIGVRRVELDELLASSDIVSVHCALTTETRHLLGAEQFKKMKPGALLVNTARGPVIDQKALYNALVEGHLAGAGLDVTDPEPIPADDPLLKLDRVILTAHSAHFSIPAFMAIMQRPGGEVARVLRGEWPLGLLNPQVKETYSRRWGVTPK
ncbi:C-terminal binding protein [Chloroflexota bacterium]